MVLTTEYLYLIATYNACYVKVNVMKKKTKNYTKWVQNWLGEQSTYSHINLLKCIYFSFNNKVSKYA